MIWQHGAGLTGARPTWLERAVIAGFIATVLMTAALAAAYGMAFVFGSNTSQAPLILRWTWGLAHNVVTEHAQTALPVVVLLHYVFGISWAVVYAAVAEPRLRGPGWRRGLLFAPLPWALSLLVFLPAVGGGLLGLGLGAGPLPILGNLILHGIYGTTLGKIYPPESDHVLIEPDEVESAEEAVILARAEHAIAIGVVLGLVLGGLAGWVDQAALAPGQPPLIALTVGALAGSATGALFGSFSGLSPRSR